MSNQNPSLLPEDLLLEVIKKLSHAELKRLALVNKAMHEVIYSERNDAVIWQPLLESYFPGTQKAENQSYRELFSSRVKKFVAGLKSFAYGLKGQAAGLRSDRDIVMVAVGFYNNALKFASEALRNDREVVLAAINASRGNALMFASEALRNDRDVVLAAINASHGLALAFASEALRGDREIVLAAVRQSGKVLRFASDALKNDREVVLAAINNAGGSVLQFASEALKNDREIVLAAVLDDRAAIEFASAELQADPVIKSVAQSLLFASLMLAFEQQPLIPSFYMGVIVATVAINVLIISGAASITAGVAIAAGVGLLAGAATFFGGNKACQGFAQFEQAVEQEFERRYERA